MLLSLLGLRKRGSLVVKMHGRGRRSAAVRDTPDLPRDLSTTDDCSGGSVISAVGDVSILDAQRTSHFRLTGHLACEQGAGGCLKFEK